MSTAEYSVFQLVIDDETPGFTDYAIPLSNTINSLSVNIRSKQRGSDTINSQRIYDVFFGTVNGAGTLDSSIDHVTLVADNTNVDQIYDDLFIPRRNKVGPFAVNALEDIDGEIKLDIALTTFGILGGQPASTILIKKFDQEPTTSELNNVIAAIDNAGSFQGMSVQQIYIKNSDIIRYVLVIAYEAAP